jgi:hypothetical protein
MNHDKTNYKMKVEAIELIEVIGIKVIENIEFVIGISYKEVLVCLKEL